MEEARGVIVPVKEQLHQSFSTRTQNSSTIISEKLVTFKDISELQDNNQKLLALVRELSTQQEDAEKAAVDQRYSLKLTDVFEIIDHVLHQNG